MVLEQVSDAITAEGGEFQGLAQLVPHFITSIMGMVRRDEGCAGDPGFKATWVKSEQSYEGNKGQYTAEQRQVLQSEIRRR
jgi:hypothetical protein